MKITYSKDADVLYIWFSLPTSDVMNLENEEGDVVRVVAQTGEIVGAIIPFAMERMKKNKAIEIPEIGNVPFIASTRALIDESEGMFA